MTTPKKLPPDTVHYSITSDAHPGALSCVLEIFALRNIIPDMLKASKYRQNGNQAGCLSIDIHITGPDPIEQEIIFHKLAAQVSVQNIREEILYRAKLAS